MKRIVISLFLTVILANLWTYAVAAPDLNQLTKRVDAFYKAKIAGNHKEAFRYENMSLDKRFTADYYAGNAARSKIKMLEAKRLSVDISENKNEAIVKMLIKYKLSPMQGFEDFKQDQERTLEDKWIYKEGDWYHIIKGVTREW